MRRSFPLVMLLIVLIPAASLRAVELIESRIIESPLVVRVRALDSQVVPGTAGFSPLPASAPEVHLTAEILEVLKGDLPLPSAPIEVFLEFRGMEARNFAAYHTEMLLFLQSPAPVGPGAPKFQCATSILLANAPPGEISDDLRTLDLQSLAPAAILAATRKEVAREPTAKDTTRLLMDPYLSGAPFFDLHVPSDPLRMTPIIRRWLDSSDPWIRVLALNAVWNFRLPDNVALAKSCLTDPHLVLNSVNYSPWSRQIYFVRVAALAAYLSEMPPDDITITVKQSFYSRTPFAWPLWLIPVAFLTSFVLYTRRGSGVRRSLFRAFVVSMTLVAISSSFIWLRSYSVADDYCYANSTHILSATSYMGALQVLRADDFLKDQPLCHATFHPDFSTRPYIDGHERFFWHKFGTNFGPPGNLFSYQSLHATRVFDPRQLPDIRDPSFPATVAVIPFRYFVPWLYLPAALWLALIVINRLRRRYRRIRSLCQFCGYDLRESPTRCPECGLGLAKI